MTDQTSGVHLTSEQEAFRSAIRRLSRDVIMPGYLTRSKSPAFPWEEYRRIAELGVLSLLLPERWGGPPTADYVAAGVAIEELGYADFNVANAVIPPMLVGLILADHAQPSVQEAWLPSLVSGEHFIALGLTEPETGSDARNLRCRAKRVDGGWVLNGEKTAMTGLPHASAAIVFARTDDDAVSAFLVPIDAPGASRSYFDDTGWVPLGRGSLALDDVEVGDDAIIGGEGQGFRTVMAGFDFTRPLLALSGIGAAQAAIDEAAAYVQDRQAFGSPLSRFEGVSFPLAEHATRLTAGRLLCYDALTRRNLGLPHTALAAMCKWYGPETAFRAAHDCLLLFGHYGYASENPMEQRLRDILAVEIADGTAQIQKIVIARELFGREFVPYGGSA
jgi:cyclohexanecarboxyl-CoA dehydrogenase